MKNKIIFGLFVMSSTGFACAPRPINSFTVVQVFKNESMPERYWAGPSCEFKTLRDAFDLAKINALFFALELPEDTLGVRSLSSGFSYAADVFLSSLKNRDEDFTSEINLLQEFIKSFSKEESDEGCAIQIIAGQLRDFISVSDIKDFNFYNKWLQHNKNPKTVKEVVSYLDGYSQTKRESHIQDLFYYLYEKVKRDQIILAQLS